VSAAVGLFILIVILNRYVFAVYLRLTRRGRLDDTLEGYEPSVTIVVPLFNEGHSICDTIASLAALDYPEQKLRVIVVDDCSSDDSHAWALAGARAFPNVRVIRNLHTMGKRRAIHRAIREVTSELIVSVDSDVIVHPAAVRELVARFTRPEIAAVTGRVHNANPTENWLTKLRTIKYYFDQEHLNNLERALDSVVCLSGCLTAFRRSVLLELEPVLEDLGVSIKYGEDRALTHQLAKRGFEMRQTLHAMCFTKAPSTLTGSFTRQLRWKRSNIIDYLVGIGDAWRLHPLVCVHYTSMLLLLFAYPLVIVMYVLHGQFVALALLHLELIAVCGIVYFSAPSVRQLPPYLRVHPLSLLPMAVLLPVGYLLLTPLGFLTFDSSSWETRGHRGANHPRLALGSEKIPAIDRSLTVPLPLRETADAGVTCIAVDEQSEMYADGAGTSSIARPVTAVFPPRPAPPGLTAPRAAEPKHRRSVPRLISNAAILGIGVLVGARLSETPSAVPVPPQHPPPPPVVAAAVEPAPPPAPLAATALLPAAMPQTIQLEVTSTPDRSTVVLDGVRLGKTPLVVTVPATSKRVWLKVRYRGYAAVRTRISLDQDVHRHVTLRPREPDPQPPK
jgi:cellulose synthase/poly-beta-1,6-N-acetylglucosamine synthase-like glycosyltransferase